MFVAMVWGAVRAETYALMSQTKVDPELSPSAPPPLKAGMVGGKTGSLMRS
jgi:hypothetical protein